jgi:hypothetical protein
MSPYVTTRWYRAPEVREIAMLTHSRAGGCTGGEVHAALVVVGVLTWYVFMSLCAPVVLCKLFAVILCAR